MKFPKARKLPSGRWRCEVCVNGNKVSIVRDSKIEAEREAASLKLNKTAVPKKVDNITLSEAIDKYISSRSNVLSPSTIKSYKSIAKYRFQCIMDLKLTDDIDWQSVVNKEADNVSAKTVKNGWSLISSVLYDNGIDVKKVRLPQVVHEEHLFLQPDQIKILIKAIEGHKYEIGYLLCLHGLRRSEMLAVKKEDVRDGYIFVSGAIVYDENGKLVHKKENKNVSSRRKVPVIIDRLNTLVEQADDGILCPYPPSTIGDPLDTVCKRNNLPIVRLHGLRHSFISLCYHLNIPALQTMELGGYSDINVMRKIYTHLAEVDRQSSRNKLHSFFDESV